MSPGEKAVLQKAEAMTDAVLEFSHEPGKYSEEFLQTQMELLVQGVMLAVMDMRKAQAAAQQPRIITPG